MNEFHRAVGQGLLVRSGDKWVTPYGKYKYWKNAVRYIKKHHHPLTRRHDLDLGLVKLTMESKPFLLNIRIGK